MCVECRAHGCAQYLLQVLPLPSELPVNHSTTEIPAFEGELECIDEYTSSGTQVESTVPTGLT